MVEEHIVLKSADAPNTFDFAVHGVTFEQADSARSGLRAKSPAAGDVRLAPLESFTADGRIIDDEADTSLAATSDGARIAIASAWVDAQPASVFPITIDPTIDPGVVHAESYTNAGHLMADGMVRAGNPMLPGVTSWRSVVAFDLSPAMGKRVTAAQLTLTPGLQSCTCPFNVWWANEWSWHSVTTGPSR